MNTITPLIILSSLTTLGTLRAQSLTLDISVDTSGLIGNAAGPFSLDFQFTDGSGTGTGSDMAVLSGFAFGGGNWTGPLSAANGTGSASVDPVRGTMALTDSSFFNEYLQGFAPGASLSFQVDLTLGSTSSTMPDEFSFAILENSLTEIPTQGPGDALVTIDASSSGITALAFQTDLNQTSIDLGLPAVSELAAVPDQTRTGALLMTGVAGLALFKRKDRRIMTQRNRNLLALAVLAVGLTAAETWAQSSYTPYTFTTIAGATGFGSTDGANAEARFALPSGAAVDGAGNIYVGDMMNNTVRKMTPVGTNWVVTTVAGLAGVSGSADGMGSAARFNNPTDVAVDSAGNLYVADTGNNTIRKLTPVGTNWVVTTLAGLAGASGADDGIGSAARFYTPVGLAVDRAGNLYVADVNNHTIREMTPAGSDWVVTTLAGLAGSSGSNNGTGIAARFHGPSGVAVDDAGNLFVADTGNSTIREMTRGGGNWLVTTLAGVAGSKGSADGTNNAARFHGPQHVAMDGGGNLYVADTGNFTIRKMTPAGSDWVVTTLAGLAGNLGANDGNGSAARFDYPKAFAIDGGGALCVADSYNNTIRRVTPRGVVTTLAGLTTGGAGTVDGTGSAARFNSPHDAAVDSAGNLYVTSGDNTIRKVTPMGTSWTVTTLAGQAGSSGANDGIGSAARFNAPFQVALDGAGNLYVADAGNNAIRRIAPVGTNWVVSTLAGQPGSPGSQDGSGTAARFNYPRGVAVDTAGNVYVGDTDNSTIRKITPSGTNWVVTTLAGVAGHADSVDGTGSAAQFGYPCDVAVDRAGNLFVADFGAWTIRQLTPAGVVTTLAGSGNFGSADGTGAAADFYYPSGLALDNADNLYVADYGNNTIRRVTRIEGAGWVVTTVGGVAGNEGYADGTGSVCGFDRVEGVAVDGTGDLYVPDFDNCTIRKGYPANSVPPPVLGPPSLGDGQFGFGITGLPALAVDIQGSADFFQWQSVGTYVLDGGTNCVVDPAPSLGTRFYRARVR